MNVNQRRDPNTTELSFIDICSFLIKKLHWLLLVGVLCALLAFVIVRFFVTPTYESRVSFYVYNTSDTTVHSGTINNNDLQAAESLATTYSKILSSNTVRSAVLDALDEPALTRKDLNRMVDVSVIPDTQLLEVVVTSTDAEQACDIADAYANAAPTEIIRITKAGGVEVVDQPEVATEKASPRTVFDTAAGMIIGMIAAAVYVILKMLSDRTIYLPEDLESMLGITVLGQIPEIIAPETKPTEWKLTEGGVIRFETKKNSKESGA